MYELLPAHTRENSIDRISATAASFAGDLNASSTETRAQVDSWIRWCRVEGHGVMTFTECIKKATALHLPQVVLLPRLFGTLPVTTASAERSFSTLRCLKTYLRSTMKEERLTNLALMTVHREVYVDTNEVLDVFRSKGDRRLPI